MPKATKKQKQKAADFSKAKLKLGKGKKLPTNQVDTSFKARSIALPTQSISFEKDANVPTTKRKLTFTDLVAHLKHHNSNVKKDALLGLRELFEAHSELVESSLASLIGACARLIGDEDASVRRSLISFFTWLLLRVSSHDLVPHSSTLLLFTTSAQTHIFPEIQIDAIRFLDLYLETFPDAVVCGWRDGKAGHGRRILEGYLSILSAGTNLSDGGEDTSLVPLNTVTSVVVLSMASKLVVLKSLSKFLRVALSSPTPGGDENLPSTSSNPTWCFSSAFPEPKAFEAFEALFRPTTSLPPDARPPIRQWKAEIDPDEEEDLTFNCTSTQLESVDAPYTLQDLENVISSTTLNDLDLDTQLANRQSDFEMRLARALHLVLLSNFLDSAPSVFMPSSAPLHTELGIVCAVADIYRNLYGALLQSAKTDSNAGFLLDSLQVILERMAPYFPFLPSPLVRRDIEQALQDLNVIYCELTSLIILAYTTRDVILSNTKRRDGRSLRIQISQVKDYVARLLSGVQMASHLVGRPITAQDYVALFPTLWMLLNSMSEHSDVDNGVDIFRALLDHSMQVSSAAAAKRPTVDFLARLTLLDTAPRYIGTFKVNADAACLQKIEQWVLHLPKTLWELGDTNIPCMEVILRFLLRLFQRRSPLAQPNASILSCVGAQLCARLIPYFTITHPTRGTVPGPFTKLGDSALQRLALDAVATIAECVPAESREPLDAAVHQAVKDSAEAVYWTEVTRSVICSK
ncbi:hypothetical protein BC827DRAFT_1124143 [Russula dissimulans]|nr:hypothetical protein BC827DRAFT_1124143 [Russula dissimulans]